jgi:hypothetical protein
MAPRSFAGPEATTGPDACRVWEIKTQGKRADDARAREMLERTAWQVRPIMRKRGWRVGTLLEMPDRVKDRYGDNTNAGERVRLKLRKSGGEWFEYEHVVLVMLHELVHNDIAPHDKRFFALLDEITRECEDLMAKGIGGTGAGFDAPGTRLGHRGGWGGVETRDAKTAAVDAARKRAEAHRVMGPPGGRRLGGAQPAAAPSPAAAAAEAAERRARAEAFAKKHGLMDDVVVQLSSSDDEDEGTRGTENPEPPSKEPPSSSPASEKRPRGIPGRDATSAAAPRADVPAPLRPRLALGRVPCRCCPPDLARGCAAAGPAGRDVEALVDESDGLKKERTQPRAAAAPRRRSRRLSADAAAARSRAAPVDDVIVIDDEEEEEESGGGGGGGARGVANGAEARGKRPSAGTTWMCGACTLKNPESASHCGACERWRFSRGAPAASRPTGFGIDD